MYKLDLHTHSTASPDGGLRPADYRRLLAGSLDYIAVTDHNTTDMALQLQAELGEHIIVGEEISTQQGELIGLYLSRTIPAGQTATQTVLEIRRQGGLVLVPHPFETVRSGLTEVALARIADSVDIIEVANARAVFQNRATLALAWQHRHGWAGAANSDAHTARGCGRTYSLIAEPPQRETVVTLLQTAQLVNTFPGVRALAAPKYHRLRQQLARRGR